MVNYCRNCGKLISPGQYHCKNCQAHGNWFGGIHGLAKKAGVHGY